jgi:uncharacterized protein (DUF983 family)
MPAASISAFADSGDGPAIFVMLIAGLRSCVGGALWLVIEALREPPFWVHAGGVARRSRWWSAWACCGR